MPRQSPSSLMRPSISLDGDSLAVFVFMPHQTVSQYSALRRGHSNFIASPATIRPSGSPAQQLIEHIDADVPARRTHRGCSADRCCAKSVRRVPAPSGSSCQRISCVAPQILEQLRRIGARHARLRHHGCRRADRRQRDRPNRTAGSVRIERRPLAQLRRIRQRLPDLRTADGAAPHENERPLVPVFANFGARRGARLVAVTAAHRFFLFRRGGAGFIRSRWRSSASTCADQKRRNGSSQASTSLSGSGRIR